MEKFRDLLIALKVYGIVKLPFFNTGGVTVERTVLPLYKLSGSRGTPDM